MNKTHGMITFSKKKTSFFCSCTSCQRRGASYIHWLNHFQLDNLNTPHQYVEIPHDVNDTIQCCSTCYTPIFSINKEKDILAINRQCVPQQAINIQIIKHLHYENYIDMIKRQDINQQEIVKYINK